MAPQDYKFVAAVQLLAAVATVTGQPTVAPYTYGPPSTAPYTYGPPYTAAPAPHCSSNPQNESFEASLGTWYQDDNDDTDWSRWTGATGSSYTGPSSAFDGQYYLYVEASGSNHPSKRAILNSPCFDLENATSAEFWFVYHMYGDSGFGDLALEASIDEGLTWTALWNESGNQGDTWLPATVNLSQYAGFVLRLRFNMLTGSSYTSDAAVDYFWLSIDGSDVPVFPTVAPTASNATTQVPSEAPSTAAPDTRYTDIPSSPTTAPYTYAPSTYTNVPPTTAPYTYAPSTYTNVPPTYTNAPPTTAPYTIAPPSACDKLECAVVSVGADAARIDLFGYTNNMHICWLVQCEAAGEVRFLSMKTEAGFDFVKVSENRYSGDETPRVRFNSSVQIDFTSDALLNGGYFSLEVRCKL